MALVPENLNSLWSAACLSATLTDTACPKAHHAVCFLADMMAKNDMQLPGYDC